jgi:hypothetical protein
LKKNVKSAGCFSVLLDFATCYKPAAYKDVFLEGNQERKWGREGTKAKATSLSQDLNAKSPEPQSRN